LAIVRFTSPFSRITGEERTRMEASTLGELCQRLIGRYGQQMNILLDAQGDISPGIVILVDRVNAHALSGTATPLLDTSEVLIMPVLAGG